MTKFFTSLLLSLFFFLGVFVSSAFAFSGSGSGTSGDPYQITTCVQLQEMDDDLDADYIQINDIDCTGVSFTPIGDSSTEFSGILNGQDFSITNITITGTDYIGLFGWTAGATIKNVRLESGSVIGTDDIAGSFIGWNQTPSTIQNSSSKLTVTGDSYAAGLVGVTHTAITIQSSSYEGTLELVDTGYMGGLVGILNTGASTINNSYSSGSFSALSTPYWVGGLVGIINSAAGSTISNSYSKAQITVVDGDGVGGLVGYFNTGTVSNSFSAVTINATNTEKGGLFETGNGTSTGNYLDSYLAGTDNCSNSGAASCTAVNSGNSDPNYFQGNSSHAPMSSWNFYTIWRTVAGSYPVLHPYVYTHASSSSSSSSSNATAPTCGDFMPSSTPDLFQIDVNNTQAIIYFTPVSNANKYFIAYGNGQSTNQYGVEFDPGVSNGVLSYTINMLSPNTTYSFIVRGGNGCMPGNWGNTMQIKTRNTSSGGASFYKNFASGILSVLPRTISNAGSGSTILGAATSSVKDCQDYTVKSGDNLWNIASQNLGTGTRYADIMHQNKLNSTILRTGQLLKVGC